MVVVLISDLLLSMGVTFPQLLVHHLLDLQQWDEPLSAALAHTHQHMHLPIKLKYELKIRCSKNRSDA